MTPRNAPHANSALEIWPNYTSTLVAHRVVGDVLQDAGSALLEPRVASAPGLDRERHAAAAVLARAVVDLVLQHRVQAHNILWLLLQPDYRQQP